MKLRKLIMAALLSAVMVLLLMPASVFAAGDGDIPVSVNLKGAAYYYEGESRADANFDVEGNSIVVTYKDGSTKEYKYVSIDGDLANDNWFLNGDKSSNDSITVYETLDDDYNWTGGMRCEVDGAEEDLIDSSIDFKPFPYPKKLSYSGAKLMYRDSSTNGTYSADDLGFYEPGNKVTVTYSDGSKKVYICKAYKDENGEKQYGYFLNGKLTKDSDGDYTDLEWFDVVIPDSGVKSGTKSLKIRREFDYGEEGKKTATGTVAVSALPKPKSAVFKGKLEEGFIGQKDLFLGSFATKGNQVIVTYTDGKKETYKFIRYKQGKYTYEGYFLNGNKKKHEIWGEALVKKGLKKGKNSVTFKLSVEDYNNVPMKTSIVARKKFAYAVHNDYLYTGKTITPKVVVKDGNNKKLPANAYTVTYFNKSGKQVKKPVGKDYGYYSYQVTLKKAYAKKYLDSFSGGYAIVPKPTSITKVTPGAGKITVKWKKQSGVSGYEVHVSRYKDFRELEAGVSAKKNQTSAVIKDLTKGKTYYVRVYTVAGKNEVWSVPSKAKSAKVK